MWYTIPNVMQEQQIEAALFQEASLKLSRYVLDRTSPSIYDDVWDVYASHFAADADPDEVDSFVESLPSIADTNNVIVNHLPPSHAVQLYGSLALRACDNVLLRDHSTRQLTRIQAIESRDTSLPEIAPVPRKLLLEAIARNVGPETAVTMARSVATRNQEYRPNKHLSILEDVAEIFETLDISDKSVREAYWQLCDEALAAQTASAKAKGYSHVADAVMEIAIPRLYTTDEKSRVIHYCDEHDLHPELALALHKNGEQPGLPLLRKAADSVFSRQTFTFTGRSVAKLYITYGHQKAAESMLKRARGKAAPTLADAVWTDSAVHAASQGDIEQALKYIRKISDTLCAKPQAVAQIVDLFVKRGDMQRFREIQDTHKLTSHNAHVQAIIEMTMEHGNLDQAIAIIEQEELEYRNTAYRHLAHTYVRHHVKQKTPEAIEVPTILNLLEKYGNKTSAIFDYGCCYDILYNSGYTGPAKELREAFYEKHPDLAPGFNKTIRNTITQGHIAAGDWLNAMHGDHLDDPEYGLAQSKYLVLVAGGIHRARKQRKQQQEAQEAKELPK